MSDWFTEWFQEQLEHMNERRVKIANGEPVPGAKGGSGIDFRELDEVIEKDPCSCQRCGDSDLEWCELDRNMLCGECAKEETSKETGIKAGNPETAFFLNSLDYNIPEYKIIRSVNYLECPGGGGSPSPYNCGFSVSHLESIRPKLPLYRMLFDHYVASHYFLKDKEHSKFQNLCYAILQEFTIYEANTKKSSGRNLKIIQDRKNRKALAMHNLMKHLSIPLNILALTIKSHQGKVGDLAFDGMGLCSTCSNSL